MKAISIIEANQCELVDISEPTAPGSGEMESRTKRIGLALHQLRSMFCL
jgi:hypothetical protein